MELIKFKIEILREYTYDQLMDAKYNLEVVLTTSRMLKNLALDLGDLVKAVEEEKIILIMCDNLDLVDTALEDKVKIHTGYGHLYLN